MSEDIATRAETLIDELYVVGIRTTSLEERFGHLLVQALSDDPIQTGCFAGCCFDDLLFNKWRPGEHGEHGGFTHFVQKILADAYTEDPTLPIRHLLTQALIIQAAIDSDPPERVIALFAEEAEFRARQPEEDDFGDPAEPLRWVDEWRRMFATTGWVPSELPDPDGWSERDITMDRCRACGRLRGSVDVEYEFNGKRHTVSEVPDPCLGILPGVGGACCGHGRSGDAVYLNQLRGPDAARKMRELGGDPPAQAFYLDPGGGAGGVNERLLNARELGQLLGLSNATVLDRFERGDLPGFRLFGKKGGPVRFRLSEVEQVLEAWRVNGPEAGGEVSPTPTAKPTRGLVYEASPAPQEGEQDAR